MTTDRTDPLTLFWFRRDLRLDDNAGLFHALKESGNVQPIFIFDRSILDKLDNPSDTRVSFIFKAIDELRTRLQVLGCMLQVYYGYPAEIFRMLVQEFSIKAVYCNHDYEPYARERDRQVNDFLKSQGIPALLVR